MLERMVLAFDCDEGLNSTIYENVRNLLSTMLGPLSAQCFVRAIDASEGRFYLKSDLAEEVWNQILDAAR
jgi:hypothetical protein